MLEIKPGRLKHDLGFSLPLDMQAVCDPAAYGYADVVSGALLAFCGKADNAAGEIQINGRLTAQLTLICSRCGAPFMLGLALPFAEIYSSGAVNQDSGGEQDKHHFTGDIIDITPEALRLLFAELPMKPLCREDCRGLCPLCGADLNKEGCGCAKDDIDPRWEKLRDLLSGYE